MKSKKTILIDDEEDDLFDFTLIGVSCLLKGYRLAWGLNKTLGLGLEKNETSVVIRSKTTTSSHVLFTFEDELDIRFDLIKNRSETYLAKELSHADYFLKIEGELDNKKDFISQIKETKGVLAVFELNPEEIKAKDNFIY